MANKWTVTPDAVKVDLADPRDGEKFWISIKKRLTVGEVKSSLMSGMKAVTGIGATKPGEEREMGVTVDWKRQAFGRAEMYLVGWSLADDKGTILKVNREVIESLDEQVFEVIDNAITAHVEAQEAEKKAQSGSQPQSQTSN